jgi:hypothetical protein
MKKILLFPFKFLWRILVWIKRFFEFILLGSIVMPFSVGRIHDYGYQWVYWTIIPFVVATGIQWFLYLWFFAHSALFIIIYALTRVEYFVLMASSSDQTANKAVRGNMDNTFSGRLGVKKREKLMNALETRFCFLLSYFDPVSDQHCLDSIENDERAVI